MSEQQQAVLIFPGRDQDLLSEALVCAQGELPFLQGPTGWPRPDWTDCSGGLHRRAVRVRGAVCLLAGLGRARTKDVQVCCRGPAQSGELDQSTVVGQPQLHVRASDGFGEEVQRWDAGGQGVLSISGWKRAAFILGEQLCKALNQCVQIPRTVNNCVLVCHAKFSLFI